MDLPREDSKLSSGTMISVEEDGSFLPFKILGDLDVDYYHINIHIM